MVFSAQGGVPRRFALVLAVALACLIVPATATAAIGDIAGQSCISDAGTDGCSALPQPGVLGYSAGIAVAPDGTDVYVGAAYGIVQFRRTAGGALTYAGCVDTVAGGSPCPAAPPPDAASALTLNSISLTISPDGRFVYAVSWAASLLWWSRNTATGALTWGGCKDGAADAATNGHCGTATTMPSNFPAGSMAYTQGISITPDGGTLYIADQQEGLLQAQLNTTTGVPTPTACYNVTGSEAAGCAALASGTPMAASGLDIGSNSRDIYLRSISPGGITHFQRTTGGVTSFFSCVGYVVASAPCATAAPNPVFSYSGAIGLAGNDLFSQVGTYGTPKTGTVAKFSRNANGTLNYLNCASSESAPGTCATLPAGTLAGAIGKLPVSTDGTSTYLRYAGTPGVLTRLTGSLGFAGCIGIGVAECTSPLLPGPFAVGVGARVLSPDGRQLYEAASNQINTFTIAATDTPAPSSPSAAPAPAPKAEIKSVRKLRKGRHRGKYRVKITVSQAGSISARFEGRLRRGAKSRALGRSAKRDATTAAMYTLYLKPSAAAVKRRVKATLVVTFTPSGLAAAQATKKIKLR